MLRQWRVDLVRSPIMDLDATLKVKVCVRVAARQKMGEADDAIIKKID